MYVGIHNSSLLYRGPSYVACRGLLRALLAKGALLLWHLIWMQEFSSQIYRTPMLKILPKVSPLESWSQGGRFLKSHVRILLYMNQVIFNVPQNRHALFEEPLEAVYQFG